MTPVSDPAHFILDPETGHYLPANKVATTLAAQMSRMRLTEGHLATIKARGFRVTKPNGEPITTGVTA
jgi:hypothetical protein